MNGKKGRAMSDADNAGGGEFLIEQFVQCVFARSEIIAMKNFEKP